MGVSTENLLDRFGVFASLLCAFHCLALPAIAAALPILGLNLLISETGERLIIFGSVILAAFSLLPGYFRVHKRISPILLASVGLGLIIITHFLLEEIAVLRFSFILSGAGLLAGGHLLNIKYCKKHESCR